MSFNYYCLLFIEHHGVSTSNLYMEIIREGGGRKEILFLNREFVKRPVSKSVRDKEGGFLALSPPWRESLYQTALKLLVFKVTFLTFQKCQINICAQKALVVPDSQLSDLCS